MTAQAGAIRNTSSMWDAVDWRTLEHNVRAFKKSMKPRQVLTKIVARG